MVALKLTTIVTCLFLSFDFIHIETKYLNESSVYRTIQASIGQLCPFSNICGLHLRPDDISSDDVPCCRECSCDDTCEEFGNCCFPEQSASAIKENYQTEFHCGPDCKTSSKQDNHKSPKHSCIIPAVLDLSSKNVKFFVDKNLPAIRSYKMITTCPPTSLTASSNDVENTSQSSGTSLNCGERNVASWGSLLPVYSPTTRTIYKNSLCAECHNATDDLVWDVKQTCIVGRRDVSDIIQNFEMRRTEDLFCSQVFLHPGKWVDIEHLRCYINITDECSKEDFEVPSGINLTVEDISAACKSDFFSPLYRKNNNGKLVTYKNVYCALCNPARFTNKHKCKNINADIRSNDGGFTYILKGSFVEENKKVKVMEPKHVVCPSKEIKTHDSGGCRNLLCPSGQMRIDGNNCMFPTTDWTSTLFICLELTPLQDISLDIFEELKAREVDSWLVSPWKDTWFMYDFVYQTVSTRKSFFLKQLFVNLKLSGFSFNIVTQIRYVISVLSAEWRIQLNETTAVSLSQRLSKSCDFFFSVSSGKCTLPFFESRIILENNRSVYEYLSNQGVCNYNFVKRNRPINTIQSKITLTKLFFCKQVLLEPSEFELEAENLVLHFKPTNTVFLPNEFSLTKPETSSNQRVRVCANAVGFKTKQYTNDSEVYRVNKSLAQLLTCAIAMWISGHF